MARIVDEAGSLTAEEISQLAAMSVGDQAEFLVLIVGSVERRAFHEHAVTSRRHLSSRYDRSILVVVALADRHIEIATAPRHAARLGASATRAILERHAVPALRDGRLADAIAAVLDELTWTLAQPPSGRRPLGGVRNAPVWLALTIIAALIGAILAFMISGPSTFRSWGIDAEAWSSDSGSGYDSGSDSGGSSDGGGSRWR